jgi:tripartite ATP-independent transporter DctP family solute receptor
VALPAAALLLVGCSGRPQADKGPWRIKASLILDQNSTWYAGLAAWRDLVERRTGGRVQVSIHSKASLAGGNQRTERDYLVQGVIQALLQSNLLLYDLDHRWGVFSLPWLFPDHDTASAVCDGPCGREMLDTLAAKGIVGLAYGANGFRQLTNNRRPVRRIEDLKGLKVRVPGAMYVPIFRAFGADPSQMSFGDLFLALKQGAMHAQENPLSVIDSAHIYEVQDHLTLWDYSYDCLVLCMNAEFYGGLPADIRETVRESAREAMQRQRQMVAEADRRLVGDLEAKGMKAARPDAAALAEFRAAAAALDATFARDFGEGLVSRFRDAVREAGADRGAAGAPSPVPQGK